MDEFIKIDFERTGGFAGIILHTTVDSNELSQEETNKLKELLYNSELMDFIAENEEKTAYPDQFSYRLTIQTGNRTYSYYLQENQVPQTARPLIRYLTAKARK